MTGALFEEIGEAERKPLKDPVLVDLTVIDMRPKSVMVTIEGRREFIPYGEMRFDGQGPQTVQMERWLAKKLEAEFKEK
jgi:hypothetical protein